MRLPNGIPILNEPVVEFAMPTVYVDEWETTDRPAMLLQHAAWHLYGGAEARTAK